MEGRVVHKRPWEKLLENATPPNGGENDGMDPHDQLILDRIDPVKKGMSPQDEKARMLQNQRETLPPNKVKYGPYPKRSRGYPDVIAPPPREMSPEEIERERKERLGTAKNYLAPEAFEGV